MFETLAPRSGPRCRETTSASGRFVRRDRGGASSSHRPTGSRRDRDLLGLPPSRFQVGRSVPASRSTSRRRCLSLIRPTSVPPMKPVIFAWLLVRRVADDKPLSGREATARSSPRDRLLVWIGIVAPYWAPPSFRFIDLGNRLGWPRGQFFGVVYQPAKEGHDMAVDVRIHLTDSQLHSSLQRRVNPIDSGREAMLAGHGYTIVQVDKHGETHYSRGGYPPMIWGDSMLATHRGKLARAIRRIVGRVS